MANLKKIVLKKVVEDISNNDTDSLYDLIGYIDSDILIKFVPEDMGYKLRKGFCCDSCQESFYPWDIFRGVESRDLCAGCLHNIKTPTDLRLNKLLNDDSDEKKKKE
jgi:hypothetical protein